MNRSVVGGEWGAAATVALMTLGLACSGSASSPTTKLEGASLCTGAWHALTAPLPFDVTSPLVYANGELYYAAETAGNLIAQPIGAGQPRTLTPTPTFTLELWAEGDHLLFTDPNAGTQVFSLPFAGGTPTLVLDGGAGRTSTGVALHHAFNATDFYWTEIVPSVAQSPTSIWHQSRTDGPATQIGSVSFLVPGSELILDAVGIDLAADAVLVAAGQGLAYAIPFDGSVARPLAAPTTSPSVSASFAGTDSSGVYWSVFPAGADEQHWEVVQSPADGGAAKRLWPSFPVEGSVWHMWPDGQGNWVVSGFQVFDDQLDHMTFWQVDAQGTSRRLGCSPGDGEAAWIRVGVAIAPDAVYAITENLLADTWEIDRIAR